MEALLFQKFLTRGCMRITSPIIEANSYVQEDNHTCSFKLSAFQLKLDLMAQISDISNTIVLLTYQIIHSHIGEIFALTTYQIAVHRFVIFDMLAYTRLKPLYYVESQLKSILLDIPKSK